MTDAYNQHPNPHEIPPEYQNALQVLEYVRERVVQGEDPNLDLLYEMTPYERGTLFEVLNTAYAPLPRQNVSSEAARNILDDIRLHSDGYIFQLENTLAACQTLDRAHDYLQMLRAAIDEGEQGLLAQPLSTVKDAVQNIINRREALNAGQEVKLFPGDMSSFEVIDEVGSSRLLQLLQDRQYHTSSFDRTAGNDTSSANPDAREASIDELFGDAGDTWNPLDGWKNPYDPDDYDHSPMPRKKSHLLSNAHDRIGILASQLYIGAANSRVFGKENKNGDRKLNGLRVAAVGVLAVLGAVLKSDVSQLFDDVDTAIASSGGANVDPHVDSHPEPGPDSPENSDTPAEPPETETPENTPDEQPPAGGHEPDAPKPDDDTADQPAQETGVKLEAYDSASNDGTLWGAQEEYGESLLGEPTTNQQTQALTQGLLDKNGLSWEQAREIHVVNGQAFYHDHQIFQLHDDEAKRILAAAK